VEDEHGDGDESPFPKVAPPQPGIVLKRWASCRSFPPFWVYAEFENEVPFFLRPSGVSSGAFFLKSEPNFEVMSFLPQKEHKC